MKRVMVAFILSVTCMITAIPASAADISNNVAEEIETNENTEILADQEYESRGDSYEMDDISDAQDDRQPLEVISGLLSEGTIDAGSGNVAGTNSVSGEWIEVNGRWWYKHSDGSYTTNGWEYIDGKWYYFDSDGWRMTGWQQIGGVWYYFWQSTGQMAIGWEHLGDYWYYFDTNGHQVTGWKKINNLWYYFFTANGRMATGWQQIDDVWYYFWQSTGQMAIGWEHLGDYWYYFNDNGHQVYGWKAIDGSWYYFLPNTGRMAIGWQSISGKSYYFDANGRMLSNTFVEDSYLSVSGEYLPGVVLWYEKGTYYSSVDSNKHLDWENVDCTYLSYVQSAMSVWNSQKSNVVRQSAGSSETDIKLYNSSEKSNVLGRTTSYPHGSGVQGKIQFMYNQLNDCNETQKNCVAIHEFGHALGLGHNEGDNIMNPTVINSSSLSQYDKNSFLAAYDYLY